MNFKVGDVVEIVAHPDAYITSWWRVGQFGTITELHIDSVIGIPRHRVLSQTDNKHFRCSERCMRKIPPPQNWVKLCELNDIPRERFTAEAGIIGRIFNV